ncbi:unnamed protein product, partial [Ectocarpus sp. 4 AP-2014]
RRGVQSRGRRLLPWRHGRRPPLHARTHLGHLCASCDLAHAVVRRVVAGRDCICPPRRG